jgi:Uma2 family endonuclease
MFTERLVQRPKTIMELYHMLPEGTLAEVINGSLFMSPSPNTRHQRILGKLYLRIAEFVEQNDLGEVFFAPYDIYLDETTNVVEPDLVFISKSKLSAIKPNGFHGVPDLIIEILSPGNSGHDTKTKKDLYERFGVSEYWIVDPESNTATGFSLSEKSYIEIGSFTGLIKSQLLTNQFGF